MLAKFFIQSAGALFHNDLRVQYVCIPTSSSGAINAPVGSDRCNHFLQEIYYRQTGRALKTRDRDEFTEHLRALAVFEGQKLPVFVRVGGDAQTVYHDLGRDDGAAVEITAEGYVDRREAGGEADPDAGNESAAASPILAIRPIRVW